MAFTLKDIARKANVAESTVSRALNNKPGVSEEKRREILEIAQKHNYRPNQLAQGLAKQRTHIIALLLSNLDNPAHTKIIKNVEQTANDRGYQVILCNTDNSLQKEEKYFELLNRNLVDGAIIVGGQLTDKNILKTVLDEKAPLVLVNRLSEELLIPTILIDSRRGAFLAAEHLIEQKLQKIALVMGPEENYQESEKNEGYQQALQKHRLTIDNDLVVAGPLNREQGYNAFLKLMELPEPPDGFFVTSSLLAAGLLEAIKMGGYHIPGDFPVVCYGDNLISSIISPPLTVVSEPLAALGQNAASYLINLIEDKPLSERIKVLKPEIKIRDSSIPQFE